MVPTGVKAIDLLRNDLLGSGIPVDESQLAERAKFLLAGATSNFAIQQILAVVKRDPDTDRVIRSHLAREILRFAGLNVSDLDYANKQFSAWMKFQVDDDNYTACIRGDHVYASVEDFAGTLEDGKPRLLLNDSCAERVIDRMLFWLNLQPRPPRSPIVRSRKASTAGQIVSPETRGAARDLEQRFIKRPQKNA